MWLSCVFFLMLVFQLYCYHSNLYSHTLYFSIGHEKDTKNILLTVVGEKKREISVLGSGFVNPHFWSHFPLKSSTQACSGRTISCFRVWFFNIFNPIIHNFCSLHTCRHSVWLVYPTEDDLLYLLISIVSINKKLITLYCKSTVLTFAVIISVCFDV